MKLWGNFEDMIDCFKFIKNFAFYLKFEYKFIANKI